MNKRYEELDSLRGLAAVFVLFSHLYNVIPNTEYKVTKILFQYSPLHILISGGESVLLFFVLSGFVLSLPYFNNKQSNYLHFLIKRLCRIYIPYIIAVIAAIVCREVFYTGKTKGVNDWFNQFWIDPINIQVVKEHFFLIGTFVSYLDPVIWSLIHEMRISMIFPILMFVLVRLDWKKGLVLGLLFSVVGVILFRIFDPADTGTEMAATFNYTAMFVIGSLLAKYRKYIADKFMNINRKLKLIIFTVGLIAYSSLHLSSVINIFIYHNISSLARMAIDSWAISVGAAIIIIFALNSITMSKILKYQFMKFLGKISYSLYLIHVVVLFASIHVLNGLLPLWSILLITVVGSLGISSLMYYYIEKPSIKLGKFLTRNRGLRTNNVNVSNKEAV